MTKTVVNLIGFDLTFSNGISVDDFFHWMVSAENTPIPVNGYTNYIFTDIVDKFIVGLIICYKGDKKILATRKEKDSLEIDKIELKFNQESTQASIFCLDPTSKCGMFYSYHGGVSKINIAKIFQKIHNKIKESKIKEKARELSKLEKPTKINKEKARETFSENFNFNVKVRSLDIDKLLDEFSEYKELEITLSPAVEPAPAFRPLKSMTSSFRTLIRLDGTSNNSRKRDAIKNLWNNYKQGDTIKALRIAGKAMHGVAHDAKIGENLEHYDQLYLDDFIDILPDKKWEDYKDSEAVKRAIRKIRANPLIVPPPKAVSTWKKLINKKDVEVKKGASKEPQTEEA